MTNTFYTLKGLADYIRPDPCRETWTAQIVKVDIIITLVSEGRTDLFKALHTAVGNLNIWAGLFESRLTLFQD